MVLIFAGLMLGTAVAGEKIPLAAVFILLLLTLLVCWNIRWNVWMIIPAVLVAMALFYIRDGETQREIQKKDWKTLSQYQAKVENVSKTSNAYAFLLKHNVLKGKILLYCKENPGVIPGDCILVNGKIEQQGDATNPGQFSARRYYLSKEIYYYSYSDRLKLIKRESDNISNGLFQARTFITRKLYKQYDEKTASLLQGMMLGDRSQISKDVKNDFKESGLIHILAVSGLHVSMTGGWLYRCFRRLGTGLCVSAGVGFFVAAGYSLLAGMSISSIRAVCMLGCYLFAQILGKSYDMLSSAAFAGSIIFFWNPYCAFDAGFVLSFTAVFVIGIYQELWSKEKDKKKKNRLLFPFIMQIGMFPVTVFLQYQMPVFSFLANALVIPMLSVLFPAAVLCVGCPPMIFHEVIELVFQVIFWISQREFGLVLIGSVPVFWVVCWYSMLFFLQKMKTQGLSAMKLTAVYIHVLLLVWIPMYRHHTVAFLDVGQGDCMAAQTDGGMILVDGGSTSIKNTGEYRILPYLHYMGHTNVQIAIITHMDEDHYAGILELLNMGRICYLGLPDVKKDKAFQTVEAAARKMGTEVFYLSRGKKIQGNDFDLEVIHPEKNSQLDKNAASIVLQGTLLGRKVLLTGDVEKEGEDQLMKQQLEQTEILKVAHHGSRFSTDDVFLEKIKPMFCLISCGKDNRYGHPHQELMERLKKTGSRIFRTDQNGAVIFPEK